MRKTSLIACLFFMCLAQVAEAHPGYHIQVTIPDATDSVVYLAHYYGKAGDRVYKVDSARFNKKGEAVFNSADAAFTGGIYMLLLPTHQNTFEFLLNNGDDMAVTAYVRKLPEGVTFKNSPENSRFEEYIKFLKEYSVKQQQFQSAYKAARTAADTSDIRRQAATAARELTDYRREYVAKYPGTLLAEIFNALSEPDVPGGPHYLADGKTLDSVFTFNYYKAHYWDKFNFRDDRLIYTPIYEPKLDEYMSRLVLPWPDSVEKESDMLLQKARGTNDVFKYTLYWLTRYAENSKVMGMDEVFVYLVENYYMKGDATWLSADDLAKYTDRAQKIAPNVIGNIAPSLKLPDVTTQQDEALADVNANYTLLVFYSPSCGHCQKELPEIDSLYNAKLKNKGVKIYAVATEGSQQDITDFIAKYHTSGWINTWDPNHTGDWKNKYDVFSTPTIYLLDDKKIIRGKRLDHSNIANVIEMTSKRKNG